MFAAAIVVQPKGSVVTRTDGDVTLPIAQVDCDSTKESTLKQGLVKSRLQVFDYI